MTTNQETDNERTLQDLTAMATVFETSGWQKIKQHLLDEVEVIKDELLSASTEGGMRYLQGRASQCIQVAYLEDTVGNMRDQIINEKLQSEEGYTDADLRL